MSTFDSQLLLFDVPIIEPIVNVASVPQRSPFRYPGGKTWLIPNIRRWLKSLTNKPSLLIEPFAGGGIVGLTAAFEELTEHTLLVELDVDVASVWQTIVGRNNEWLAQRILEFDLTRENVTSLLAEATNSIRKRAFRTILRNRTLHGGILARGSSLIKRGENGKGIRSRWYPETLATRIRNIGKIRDRFTFLNTDGLDILEENLTSENTAFFIDPPYTVAGKKAGKRLYNHHLLDHDRLFSIVSKLNGNYLMTYDIDESIIKLAEQHGMETRTVPMKNTHHARMHELLIGKDLSWMINR